MLNISRLNTLGKAVAKAFGPDFRSILAIQKRNQCKYEDDNEAMKKQYDEQDSQFTDQELNLFKKLFLKYDRDDNCKLDRWEFNQFAKFLVGRSYNSIDLEKVFYQLDSNNDGLVDWNELMIHVMIRNVEKTQNFVMEHFKEFDRDNDGKLGYWEAKLAMKELGMQKEFNKDIFNLIDRNKDEMLSFDELCGYVLVKKYNHLTGLMEAKK